MGSHPLRRLMAVSLLAIMGSALAQAQSRSWVITKSTWTSQDEARYSAFIQSLGRSKCNDVHSCITGPGNPYRSSDPSDVRFYSDCADFPYFLRAYFAWKNELPFSYIGSVRSFDADERKKNPPVLIPGEELKPLDSRYSALGNYAVGRTTLIPSDGKTLDFFSSMARLQNTVFSGTLRIGPSTTAGIASDFYSPAIKLGSIRPGTTIYDPNGHVAVIYDILPDGRVLHFDAHPDNSVTHGTFSAKFSRSSPAQGAGFKNFRPFEWVGAKPRSDGSRGLTGGKLIFKSDSDIADFDVTQYYGSPPVVSDWKAGTFEKNGRSLNFHEYVRSQLATEKISPVVEFQSALEDLCNNMRERAASVEAALRKNIHLKPHPDTLPANLFGSEGDWENFSTPGRDTRLRASFLQLQSNVETRYQQWIQNDFSDMKYSGENLKKDLLRAFHGVNLMCPVSYTNSNGKKIHLGFELAIRRLFKMSFDPYHCPELRWGASHPQEKNSCPDGSSKISWYEAQQSIRNFLQRDWSASRAITIDDLRGGKYGSTETPLIDLKDFLERLPSKKGAP